MQSPMPENLASAARRAILLDIEGTTTPISFVHEVLFPYSRAHLEDYLSKHWESAALQEDLASLQAEHAVDLQQHRDPPALMGLDRDEKSSIVAYVNWLIDRDRKSAALKNLQGKIWKDGYLAGTLEAELFEDVAPILREWRTAGIAINIFSSGSSLAQQLLFSHTQAGDLSGLIDNYFDTSCGAKTVAESYRHIAGALQLAAENVLFISDVVPELDAAKNAGMETTLCVRPGNAPQLAGERHRVIHSLRDIVI